MDSQETQLVFSSGSPEQTLYCGRLLGLLLDVGDVVGLIGELGAGKTTLTQGIAKGLGVGNDCYVTSPTFTIMNEYKGRIPVYHLDFYRIESPLEIDNLGLEEYLPGEGVTIIEWAEKIEKFLPKEHLMIMLDHVDDNVRNLNMRSIGERYGCIVNRMAIEIHGNTDCKTVK